MMKPAKTPLYLALLAGLALPMTANAQMNGPVMLNGANHYAGANHQVSAGNMPNQIYIAPQLRTQNTYTMAPQGMRAPAYAPQMMRPAPRPMMMQPAMRPVQTGRYAAQRPAPVMAHRHGPNIGRYGQQTPQQARPGLRQQSSNLINKLLGRGDDKHMYAGYRDRLNDARLPQYQMRPAAPHAMDQFLRWDDSETEYALYPGDQVDIVVGSAPELSRTLTVGPDGRVVMPMTQPIMAAGKSLKKLEAAISAELAKQLVDPRVAVTPRAYGPQQIFVGGQVGAQGTYTLPGPVGVTEAVLMAGGFSTSAQLHQVVVLRRTPSGNFMARTIDFRDGLRNPLSLADNVQLRRGDVVFVPRSHISEVGLFMQQYVRDALPIGLNVSYNLGEGTNN